jgi:hypothetical protein
MAWERAEGNCLGDQGGWGLAETLHLNSTVVFTLRNPPKGMHKPAQTQPNGDGCSGESHAYVALLSKGEPRAREPGGCLFDHFRGKKYLQTTAQKHHNQRA